MAGPATLKIEIIADAAKAVSGLGKLETAAGKAGSNAETAGGKFKTFAKHAAMLAGSAALGGLVSMFKTGFQEQSDFLSGQAQLANGLQSTGNAAHTSVKHLEDLASSVQNYSGQSDDSIVSSEKLLLTFTKVGNKAGKNNDIFDQATKMTADMAAKMGGDASKYAVQLGKALNDPVKGISSLTKVGVTFTDQQKKQIKAMDKSHNTIGAQKVILGELKKEFGGSAKAAGATLPGQMKRVQRSFEDVSQQLVAAFMPALSTLADILTKDVMPAFQKTVGFITKNIGWVGPLALGILALVGAFKLWKLATSEVTKANLKLAASMLTNPVFLIIAGIVLLVAAFVLAYNKSETFRRIVHAALDGVKKAAAAVGDFFVKTLPKAFQSLVGFLKKWGPAILAVLLPFIGIPLLIWQHFSKIKGFISRALSGIGSMIAAPFGAAWTWIHKNVVTPMSRMFSGAAGWMRSALSGVGTAIASPFGAAWTWIHKNVVTPISNMFNGIVSGIGRALSGVEHAITAPFEAAWNWIDKHVISPIKSVWNGIAGAINAVHFSVKIPSFVPGIGGKGFTFDPPTVPTLARGGVVDKATLAMIGEGPDREIAAPEALLRKIVAEGGGTTVNVYGALDPDAVARQIEKILAGRARRAGGVVRRGAPVGGVA